MVRRTALALVAVLLLGTGTVFADQRRPRLDRSVRAALASGKRGPSSVIIQMRPGVRSELRKALLDHGDSITAEHPSINALTADVHGEDLAALANDPAILALSSDAPVRASGSGYNHNSRRSQQASQYVDVLHKTLGLTSTRADGDGIGVAVIDSGLAPVGDFSQRITAFYDFTRGGPLAKTPYDDCGHGTHIGGLIAGSGEASDYYYMGVAPEARLIGLKVLDRNGNGRTSDVIRAIDFAVANRARFGIDVINLSLGHPILEPAASDPLVMAVERAVAAGVVVVTSAGNYGKNRETGEVGYAGVTSPGNAPSAITVGASRTYGTVGRGDDDVAPYSSRGPSWYDGYAKPDVLAPGDSMVSVASSNSELFEKNPGLRVRVKNQNNYFTLSGTSMSAAVVSGVVALVLEESRRTNPGGRAITPNAVKGILQYSSIPIVGNDVLAQGAGSVNAGGAVGLASRLHTSALYAAAGTTVIEPGFVTSTVIDGVVTAWGRNIVWGTQLVSGSESLWENNLVWGDNIVWGTRLDDENVVWGTLRGDNIVWGTLSEAENVVWGTLANIENIVWGTASGWQENVVWGASLLTTTDGQAIGWGTVNGENIVWGTLADVGGSESENVVWGTLSGDGVGSERPDYKGGR